MIPGTGILMPGGTSFLNLVGQSVLSCLFFYIPSGYFKRMDDIFPGGFRVNDIMSDEGSGSFKGGEVQSMRGKIMAFFQPALYPPDPNTTSAAISWSTKFIS